MSYETNTPARHRPWPRRRILGSVLGLAVVVGTGAIAEASTQGDGFLRQGATQTTAAGPTNQANTRQTNGYNGQGNGYNGRTSTTNGNGYNGNQGYHGDTDNRHTTATWQATATPQNPWTWNGWGGNRWGFRTVVDRDDPTFNQALGINNKGSIVGYFGSGKDANHPNQGWWASSPYTGNSFHNVNFPGSMQTQVVGINDAGTAVGFYVEGDGSNHGFVRWHGQYFPVDFPRTTSSPSFNQLLGISPNGIAAGFWNDAAGNAHGYLYDTNTRRFTPIRLPWGATSVTVTGVTDNGTVVGFAVVHKVTVAFVVTRHTAVVIRLGDRKNTQALGVNRWGVVVGSFEDAAGKTHGFVWAKGRLRVVDAPWGATSTVVNGLNDAGWIVGFFEDGSGNTKGFLARQ